MPEPWFASTLDGISPVSSSNINTLNVPVTSSRGFESISSSGSGADSPTLPERTSGSAGFFMRINTVDNNSGVLATYLGASSGNRIRIARTATGGVHSFQYWDGSAWVTVGATFTLLSGEAYQFRIDWSGYGTANGTVYCRVFTDSGETPIATRSATGLNFSALSGIVRATFRSPVGTQASRYSALFICDADGDSSYVYTSVANADGADTGGTGTFASINSTGAAYDTTFISLPASGNRRSVKNTANRNYDNRTVRAVAVNARLRRGATGPTQARVYLTIGGVRYNHPTTLTLTTAFESYCMVWETDPSTSAAWTLTNAQAASLEWGVEAV